MLKLPLRAAHDVNGARAAVAFALALTALVCGPWPGWAAGQAVPPDVRSAAERGLQTSLAAGGTGLQGFPTGGPAPGGAVGAGIQIFTVSPERLLGTSDSDLRKLATPSGQWLFLVMSKDGPNALLTVDRVNGAWTAVSIGAAGLARELAATFDRWPSPTYQVRFIRSYQANAELLEVSRAGSVLGAVPFLSGRLALGGSGPFDPSDLWSMDRIVTRMRPIVRTAIRRR